MKKLLRWLDRNDMNPDITLGDSMYYDHDEMEISIGSYDEEDFEDLDKLIRNLGFIRTCDMTTFCFLHELGHYNTIDDLSETTLRSYRTYDFMKPILNSWLPYFIRKRLKDAVIYSYHRQDVELAATLWACHFMQENEKEVDRLQKILKEIYEN